MIKYNITDKIQFPDISRFDPVARVIGLRPGQVCNIIRASKTAIEANYYRICV
jgi:DNA-directed RNA polymerase subunit H (RpoH/RPB5)